MRDWSNESPEKLAEWWCSFNKYEYPPDFPVEKPDFFNENFKKTFDFIGIVMGIIGEKVAHKELLRQWNIDYMPGKEFDAWWEKRGEREE